MCQALYSTIVEICRVLQSMRHKARGHTVNTRSPRGSQERFVHQKLVVAVLVQALHAGAVAADAMHARRRVARELDPLRLERVKLRMDHGSRKRNLAPARTIEAAGHEPALRVRACRPPSATRHRG